MYVCELMQESALRSRHITVVKKGWLSKGPDSNPDAISVSFTRVSVDCCDCIDFILRDVCCWHDVEITVISFMYVCVCVCVWM